MDLTSRLLLLLEVNELGTFAKVADHRNVDRSVISKQINKLEHELGVRVLNRTTRSLSLTAAGNEMIQQAIQLRQLINETKHLAQNYHSEPKGRLKITSSSHFGRQYVQRAIIEFQRCFPEVEIELRLEDRLVDMVGEGYDIGFRFGEPKDSSLVAKKLGRNRLAIVASDEFIERHGLPNTLDDIRHLPCAIYASTGLVGDQLTFVNNNNQLKTMPLNAAYKVNDVEMLVRAAESGNMFAVVAAQMIHGEVKDGKLKPILTDIQLVDYGALYAVYPHREAPKKTRLFIETIQNLIGIDLPVWEANIPGFENMYGFKNGRKTFGAKNEYKK